MNNFGYVEDHCLIINIYIIVIYNHKHIKITYMSTGRQFYYGSGETNELCQPFISTNGFTFRFENAPSPEFLLFYQPTDSCM